VEEETFCKKHVEELLGVAVSIMDSHPRYALGLYTFAVEEYGKALWLEDIRASGSTNGRYTVPTNIRSDHHRKFKYALDALPHECTEIKVRASSVALRLGTNATPISQTCKTVRGMVSIPPYTTDFFFDIVERVSDANFDARMSCFYLDWDQHRRQWRAFFSPDKESLAAAMQKFREYLHGTTRS